MILALAFGCDGRSSSSTTEAIDRDRSALSAESTRGLLDIAIDNLNRQEEFAEGEMLPQIVVQLNQWVRDQPSPPDWRLDPAIETLPSPLADVTPMQGLDQLQFLVPDSLSLQEAVWLRNVSTWARGDQLDDLQRARRLFDWTVRNIELEVIAQLQTGRRLLRTPWETLLLGRGSVWERAWVFLLLARQQGLDAVILAVPDENAPEAGSPDPWAIGVLIEKQVYLFEPTLSMPVPAPEGIRLSESGELEIRPATLAEVAADDALLRQLDLDAERPYPMESSDLEHLVALVEASPAYLAKRMRLVESQLLGDRKMVLSASPTRDMEHWAALPQVAEARLWQFPYATLLDREHVTEEQAQERWMSIMPFYSSYSSAAAEFEPPPTEEEEKEEGTHETLLYQPQRTPSETEADSTPLHRARLLHFKGALTGPQSATVYYQQARPSDEDLGKLTQMLYDLALSKNPDLPAAERRTPEQLQAMTLERENLLHEIKHNASYWLGLLNYDQGLIERARGDEDAAAEHFATAVDYLAKRTLDAWPGGPWAHGAHYNLGRVYESLGQCDRAIAQYMHDIESPAFYGNILRARWLDQARSASERLPESTNAPRETTEEPTAEEPRTEVPLPQPPDADASANAP